MQELATKFIEISKLYSAGEMTKPEYMQYTSKVEQYLKKNNIPFVDFVNLTK